MRILDSNEYIGEKLNIKPITKKRLKNGMFDWKNKLKTGDAVIIKLVSDSKKEYTVEFFYVSEEDYNQYKSIFNFDMASIETDKLKNGMFIRWRWGDKKYEFSMVSQYGDINAMRTTSAGNYEYVCRIYRNEKFEYPLTGKYFKDNQNLVFALSYGWSLVYDSVLNH